MAATKTKTTTKKAAKQTAPALRVPQTVEEANALLAEYAAAANALTHLDAGLKDATQQVTRFFEEQAAPQKAVLADRFQRLQAFAEAHRSTLVPKGRKSIELPAGLLSWRTRPPRVEISKKKGALETIIETIKTLKLTSFLRVKEELNKEAILAHPEAVDMLPGVTIRRDEEQFEVLPKGLDLADTGGAE